jgi:hypothetical protein
MENSKTPSIDSPPSLFSALKSGFDAIANQIVLIIFPIALDMFIWLGPHLRIKQLIDTFYTNLRTLPGWQSSQTEEMLQVNQAIFTSMGERLNLTAFLRTFPVGVPSLMVGRLPITTPVGNPSVMDLRSWSAVIGVSVLMLLVGVSVGVIYFNLVRQAALTGKIQPQITLMEWPQLMVQVLALSVLFFILVLVISVPASCLVSLMAYGGLAFGQITLLLCGGMLLWVIFPLLLSPFGIFVHHNRILDALRSSIRTTRMTITTTSLLFLITLVLTQGLDLLWNVPPDTSWLMLIGITGHAFVVSGLLAGIFIYYRDAENWTSRVMQSIGK